MLNIYAFFLIKLGIPDRWGSPVLAEAKQPPSFISVPCVHIPQIEKTAWWGTYGLIQAKNLFLALFVLTVARLKTNWYGIFVLIVEKNHFFVPIALVGFLPKVTWRIMFVSTQERSRMLVQCAHTVLQRSTLW